MSSPEPRVVLVTGAGGGLGSAVAERFTARGDRVVKVDRVVPEDPGEDWFRADISSEAELVGLAEDLHQRVGQVSMVFNIAGVLDRGGLSMSVEDFRTLVDINLVGTYAVIRAFAADMVDSGWGRIVNVGSVAAVNGYPALAYAASKAGIVSLTRSLLHDLWGTGVTVNAVCPGAMVTPMMDPGIQEAVRKRTPTGGPVSPDDVASAFEFFAADSSGSVNGQVLIIDGGATSVFAYT
jgi:3-oxoacyl-[acyl-carrier protein] reductase